MFLNKSQNRFKQLYTSDSSDESSISDNDTLDNKPLYNEPSKNEQLKDNNELNNYPISNILLEHELIKKTINNIPKINSFNSLNSYNSFKNLKIQDDKSYKDPMLIHNINLEKYFHKDDIELANKNKKMLQITDKGLYTVSKYYDAQWISNIIIDFLKSKSIIPKYETIIDATSGIGGNTINFSKHFKHVHSIEINNIHYQILNNNIDALLINNVTTYCNNFFNIIHNIYIPNNKILFFDPPWGGFSHKNYQYFNLKVGLLTIYDALNKIYDIGFKYVILKAPFNLNISMVYANIKFKNMNVHTNDKKNMLIIIFY